MGGDKGIGACFVIFFSWTSNLTSNIKGKCLVAINEISLLAGFSAKWSFMLAETLQCYTGFS